MKKLIALLLSLIMILPLFSCSVDHNKNAPASADNEDSTQVQVESTVLETSAQPMISRDEAIAIAKRYWQKFNIEENGYIVGLAQNKSAPSSVYVIVLKWLVVDHYSTIDEIWVDKNTGETIIPFWSDAKG